MASQQATTYRYTHFCRKMINKIQMVMDWITACKAGLLTRPGSGGWVAANGLPPAPTYFFSWMHGRMWWALQHIVRCTETDVLSSHNLWGLLLYLRYLLHISRRCAIRPSAILEMIYTYCVATFASSTCTTNRWGSTHQQLDPSGHQLPNAQLT